MKVKYLSLTPVVNHCELERPVDWPAHFDNAHSLEVEIGFGTGEYLVRLAAASPQTNYVGIEEHSERTHKTLRKIALARTQNICLVHLDARVCFERLFKSRSVVRIHCLFPCPWPKRRQTANRLFSTDFLKLLNNRLTDQGQIKLVTDYYPYVQWVKGQADSTGFAVEHKEIGPQYNTKFERKWLEAGQQKFFELQFLKNNHHEVPVKEDTLLQNYFIDDFSPRDFNMPDQTGARAVIIKDFLYDEQKQKALVQLLVAEDSLSQYVWVAVQKQRGRWRIGIVPGTLLIPTDGVAEAVRLVFEAAQPKGSANV